MVVSSKNRQMRQDAFSIINEAVESVLPDDSVVEALQKMSFEKDVAVVAIGKAAWNMTRSAKDFLGDQVKKGVVLTKYEHSMGPIEGMEIIEAGHPIPDGNSILGAKKILEMVSKLTERDLILFLVSGGGSSLFEIPMEGLLLEDLVEITDQLLSKGAEIGEINTVRKHLSQVKGGKFAKACEGLEVKSLVLSDVIGDHLDVIASGPAYPDSSTSEEAFEVIRKFGIEIDSRIKKALEIETPKEVHFCECEIIGSVSKLCMAASKKCQALGYEPLVLSTSIDCEAKEAGRFLSAIARDIVTNTSHGFMPSKPCAIIVGGETIVHLKGDGKGGRNQEIALSASKGIQSLDGVVIFSVGSDGTDGPTDAAGGIVDGGTVDRIKASGIDPDKFLDENDSYHALNISKDLIITGATGTNVNDLMVILIN